jgi:WD40 repeat protein
MCWLSLQIRLWDFVKGTCEVVLNGHKSAVTALRYSKSGSLLASGAKDTDIVVWDVVGETGLYRLKGHRDQVTDLVSFHLLLLRSSWWLRTRSYKPSVASEGTALKSDF